METSRPESSARAEAGHELADHTSEITMRLHAPTYEALVAEATRAFAGLVPAALRGELTGESREFRIRGIDRTAALVGWLNEMVYSCEVDRWLPVQVDVTEEPGPVLFIQAEGVALAAPFVLVKAATLHRASVEEREGTLVAEVTLDV